MASDLLTDDRYGAEISEDGQYRFWLWRTWDVEKPELGFIMLNPSTADDVDDDPTIRRCIGFARSWGYGKISVGNLFAYRTSEPDDLYDHPDPVGPGNDEYLRQICETVDKVIAAWGTNGALNDRGKEVTQSLDADLYALDVTKDGHPAHPLYQPADTEPIPFTCGDEL